MKNLLPTNYLFDKKFISENSSISYTIKRLKNLKSMYGGAIY